MKKVKDETFIYTNNDKKIGARAKIDGEPALAIVKNGKVDGYIPVADLTRLLYDTRKPCIYIDSKTIHILVWMMREMK